MEDRKKNKNIQSKKMNKQQIKNNVYSMLITSESRSMQNRYYKINKGSFIFFMVFFNLQKIATDNKCSQNEYYSSVYRPTCYLFLATSSKGNNLQTFARNLKHFMVAMTSRNLYFVKCLNQHYGTYRDPSQKLD